MRYFVKIFAYLKYIHSFWQFYRLNKRGARFALEWSDRWPCLYDNTPSTGFDRHYVYHPSWAARIIQKNSPKLHVDISSTVYFCTLLSAFIPVDFYDYRPANVVLSGLKSGKADLTNLHFDSNSISSLSCMHTVEHIGLGRYGDKIDYEGDIKAMTELARVLAKDGSLLFVVPIGREGVIQYNAHRIYTKRQIIGIFEHLGLRVKEFALIPEHECDGNIIVSPSEELLNRQTYACGCFWFVK